jgi:hypothetical protein
MRKNAFVPVKTRQHIFAEADISGVRTKEGAWERVFAALDRLGEFEAPVIQVDLTGSAPLEVYLIDTALLEEEIIERYGAVSASVSTLLINAGAYRPGDEDGNIDRRQMEKRVLLQIIKETGYDDSFSQSLSDFAMNLKENTGNRFNFEEIADTAEELAAMKAGGGDGH